MTVGLALPTRSLRTPEAVRDVLDLAEALDRHEGWSDLWVGDSLLALPFFESMTLMAAIAARTERIGIGVACQATLGLRDPVLLAAQWAAVDQLSGGRATLVACPGWGSGDAVRAELRAYDINYVTKTQRMERNIALLREASVTGAITLGDAAAPETHVLPTPFVQQPLPIWFTANPAEDAAPETVERLLDRVARLGDGWLTYAIGPELLAERIAYVRGRRVAYGKDPAFPVCVGVNANVHPDVGAARADALSAWARVGSRNVAIEDVDRLGAIGDAGHIVAKLDALRAAGATHFSLYLLSDHPREQAALLTDHLLPAFAP
jgi:alkanesulfonate monooxygenase SsuD/methylene tetrahydromethanopterin reductase-like flavin-dependent oxidoreductase (luciferase family)